MDRLSFTTFKSPIFDFWSSFFLSSIMFGGILRKINQVLVYSHLSMNYIWIKFCKLTLSQRRYPKDMRKCFLILFILLILFINAVTILHASRFCLSHLCGAVRCDHCVPLGLQKTRCNVFAPADRNSLQSPYEYGVYG